MHRTLIGFRLFWLALFCGVLCGVAFLVYIQPATQPELRVAILVGYVAATLLMLASAALLLTLARVGRGDADPA